MESDAFLRSGIRRLLPKSLQELFDFIYPDRRNEILKRNEGQTAYSRRSRSERWIPDGWICSCKNKTTLWIETQVAVSDRLQIYCEGCHNLVGWGTDDEFDKAHEECLASWVEHSETEIVKKFDPPPAIGMTAYLRNHMDDFSYLFKDAS